MSVAEIASTVAYAGSLDRPSAAPWSAPFIHRMENLYGARRRRHLICLEFDDLTWARSGLWSVMTVASPP